MKAFLAFARKEFFHIFRDPRTLIILFGIPVVQLLIFGYVVNNDIKDVPVAVLNLSGDNTARELCHKLFSSGYFINAMDISSEKEIKQAFATGRVKEVLVFEPGFGTRLIKEGKASVQVLVDASDPNMANLASNYTRALIMEYAMQLNRSGIQPVMIESRVSMLFNKEMKSAYMFVPGTVAVILMLISAMMTSISITREKEMGTMEVLLVSPLKPLHIILGKVAPYVVLAFFISVVIITMGHYIFMVPVRGSLWLLFAECTLFLLLALSLGVFISTVARDQQVAMFISMVALMLPSILLSGYIFPIEYLPGWLQAISLFMPPRWFIVIIKSIMIKGSSLQHVWHETLILAAMAIVFIGLSARKFKVRLG